MSNVLFDKLFLTKCNAINIDNYPLADVEQLLNNLIQSLKTEKNNTLFIKKYEYIYMCFGYMMNLYHNNGQEDNVNQIFTMFINFKFLESILKRIFEIKIISPETCNIDSTIKLINPFITNRINNTFIAKIANSITVFKRYEDIMMETNKLKKTLNLIIYRNLYCNKNTFHEYFVEYHQIANTEFIVYIPDLLELMNVNTKVDNAININVSNLIKHVAKTFNIMFNLEKMTLHPNGFSTIKLEPSKNGKHELDIQLQKVDFIKPNCVNYYVIYYGSLTTTQSVLHLIHLLVIANKMCKTTLNSLYDSINLVPLNNYYYDSFVCFLMLLKNNPKNIKFIIDLLKMYYSYSLYDYYFYYDSRLMASIKKNIDKKQQILMDFCNHLQNKLHTSYPIIYPPFIEGCDGDIDNIIYYGYDIPNYFKFNQLVTAIYYVFNINKNTNLIDAMKNWIKTVAPPKPVVNKINTTNVGFDENYEKHNTAFILNTERVK